MFTHQCTVCYKHWIIERLWQLTFLGKQIHSSCPMLLGSASPACLKKGMRPALGLLTSDLAGWLIEKEGRGGKWAWLLLIQLHCTGGCRAQGYYVNYSETRLSPSYLWQELWSNSSTFHNISNHFLLLSAAGRFTWLHDSSHTVIWWLNTWIIWSITTTSTWRSGSCGVKS